MAEGYCTLWNFDCCVVASVNELLTGCLGIMAFIINLSPGLRLGHYSLGAFRPLNPIETLELASNYYVDTTPLGYRPTQDNFSYIVAYRYGYPTGLLCLSYIVVLFD